VNVTLVLNVLIHPAGANEDVDQVVRDHLHVTSTHDAVIHVTYEAEPTVLNA
jgi:hypothetical protein